MSVTTATIVLQLLAQAFHGLILPVALIVISILIWHDSRKWVPIALLFSATMQALQWLPQILLHPLQRLSLTEFTALTPWMIVVHWLGTVSMIAGLIGLAVQIRILRRD